MGERRVTVITDSTACLPPRLVDELSIQVVPVSVAFSDGTTYRDRPGFDGDLRARLESGGVASTSAPSPGEYLRTMRASLAKTPGILCVTVAARFSAMLGSASKAAELLAQESPGCEVSVVDSGNAAMAQGFAVLAAARAAASGAALDECRALAESTAAQAHLVFAIDDLRYLARGGRVPSAVAWAANVLDVKPVVHYHSGVVKLMERTRHMDRALRRMVDRIEPLAAGGGRLHLAVQHAGSPGRATILRNAMVERYGPSTVLEAEFTNVMMTHTGPGVVGLAFYRERGR